MTDMERELPGLELVRWGRVAAASDRVGWEVVDADGRRVEPIYEFLRELRARDASAGTVRSYAYDLLRWWRFLGAVGVDWDKATSAEVRDLVLWLQRARKPIAGRRRASAATAGTVNPVTRKPHLGDGYAARTVRHSNAVLRAFYDYWIDERGEGPLVNPVPRAREWSGERVGAHRSPLEPFVPRARLRYNPRLPRQRPRAIPDEQWASLFAALRSDRDRAIVAMAISSGARAGELLGLRGADLDWGEQLIRVRRKGTGAQQWLPVSAEAFVWLRLYLDELGELAPDAAVWWTLRRRGSGTQGSGAQGSGTEGSGTAGVSVRAASVPVSSAGSAGSAAALAEPVSRSVDGSGPQHRAMTTSPPPIESRIHKTTTQSETRFRRPLSYDAWRAVFRRLNTVLGTNWTMHDLRHTCALRMVRDERLSLRDVQDVLGHAHLATTQLYLQDDDAAVLGRVQAHLAACAAGPPTPAAAAGSAAAAGYAADDLAVLLGTTQLGTTRLGSTRTEGGR